jgi:hypothetical protein
MIRVKLTKSFTVTSDTGLDAHTDAVMDELMTLEECTEGISDSDMNMSLTNGEVEISVLATADDFDEALKLADSTIRAAIHAAGGNTHTWITPTLSPTGQHAELVDA